MNLYLDIETMPNAELIKKLFPYPEFDRDAVNLGNAKKQETIDAKIEEARQKHNTPEARTEWQEKHEKKCQLDGLYGRVCATGLLVLDYDMAESASLSIVGFGRDEVINDAAEAHYIRGVWSHVCNVLQSDGGRIFVWSGCGSPRIFDLDFLIQRSRILGIHIPHGLLLANGYYTDRVVDVARVLLFGERNAYLKLDTALELFGYDEKKPEGIDGAGFWKAYLQGDRSLAERYLTHDVYGVRKLAEAICE